MTGIEAFFGAAAGAGAGTSAAAAAGTAAAGTAATGAGLSAASAGAAGLSAASTGAGLTMGAATGITYGGAAAGTAAAAAGAGAAASGLSMGTILQLTGAGLSAMGSIQQAKAAQSALSYNIQSSRMYSDAESNRLRAATSRQLSAIRTGVSKSGVTMEGTPLMVMAESAANAEIDALNIAWNQQQQESLMRAQSNQVRRQSYYSAGTSLLSAAGRYF